MKSDEIKPKIIAIVGPTACGKTKLATRLAFFFNGEVVSCDSRQVYKNLNIGTGKDLEDYLVFGKKIPYHLIDVLDPRRRFSLFQYQKLAYKAIDDVLMRKSLPFLVGGTGYYLDAVVNGLVLPKLERRKMQMVKKKIEAIPSKKRVLLLKNLDSKLKIDFSNERRVINRLVFYYLLGKKPSEIFLSKKMRYRALKLGVIFPIEKIRQRIKIRVNKWLKGGLIEEVQELISKRAISLKRLEEIGLEYRLVVHFLEGIINKRELKDQLIIKTGQYAKRQITWFRRDPKIKWVERVKDSEKIIRDFLLN